MDIHRVALLEHSAPVLAELQQILLSPSGLPTYYLHLMAEQCCKNVAMAVGICPDITLSLHTLGMCYCYCDV